MTKYEYVTLKLEIHAVEHQLEMADWNDLSDRQYNELWEKLEALERKLREAKR